MNQKRVIAIDTGNRHIKTPNHVFPASFIESGHLPSFGGDTLTYEGKEYTLIDRRMPQKTDKTKDDSYFILALFAIGKELSNSMDGFTGDECIDVELLVGLPPLHCKELGAKYARYFKGHGEKVCFNFNSLPISVNIMDVYVYPQAYAAALTVHNTVKDSRIINIVDIGGYTVDCLQLTDFRPDMSVCTSLYSGVNTLFQIINEQVRATGAKDIPDSIMESILRKDNRVLQECSPERIELINIIAKRFSVEMLLGISQAGLDLNENRTVFVGGGAILLREHIEKSGIVAKSVFVDDIQANACGYQLLYENRRAGQAQP
jgi:plasmid segregation protein ParM